MPNGTEPLPPPQDSRALDEMMEELKSEDLQYKKESDPKEVGQRVKIQTNNVSLEEQTELAVRALYQHNKPPRIFSRACMLSRVRYDERNTAIIESLDQFGVRYYLARSAFFVKTSYDEKTKEFHDTKISPPMDVTHDVMASCDHEFPQLLGLSETPIIKDNGDVWDSPGYDHSTMLYFSPSNGVKFPKVSDTPTSAEILVARNLLQEAIVDFPFVDEFSRANALAAMITPVLRPIIRGNIPMCVIGKPQAGTGASLLCEVISITATGQDMATINEQKTEEEWQKVITSILRNGRVLVTIDNVEGKLFAPALASLLTSSTYQGRILGRSEMITLPNRTVWIANGNNIMLGGDLPRRCYTVLMDAKSAQPWLRPVQFQHPDLRRWAKDNRGFLVNAILTLAKGWIQAGRPTPPDLPVLGSFEDWCTTVGGILHFAGVQGFLGNLNEMYQNMDQDNQQWESFLLAWYDVFKDRDVSVSDIYDHLKRENDSNETLYKESKLYPVLPDWLGDEFVKKNSFVRKLGKALSKKDGVCFASGVKLTKGSTKNRAVLWKVYLYDRSLYESYSGAQN